MRAKPAVNAFHGFVEEGTFVAFPLRFPSVSKGIPDDEARIQRLFRGGTNGRVVFGTTHGARPHVFAAALGAPYGYVLDLGTFSAERRPSSVALVPRPERYPVCLVGLCLDGGSELVADIATLLSDGIQEWGFRKPSFKPVASFEGEHVSDLLRVEEGLLCVTDRAVRLLDAESFATRARTPVGTFCDRMGGRLVVAGARRVLFDEEGGVCEIRIVDGELIVEDLGMSLSGLDPSALVFGVCGESAVAVADGQGAMAVIDLKERCFTECAPAPVAPVHCVAGIADGRLYGFCGDGIGRLFRSSRHGGETADLGAVAAVAGERRYAYHLGSVVANANGHLLFGENDRGGHVWLYCPPSCA